MAPYSVNNTNINIIIITIVIIIIIIMKVIIVNWTSQLRPAAMFVVRISTSVNLCGPFQLRFPVLSVYTVSLQEMKSNVILLVFRFSLMKILEKSRCPLPTFSELCLLWGTVGQNICVEIWRFNFHLYNEKAHKTCFTYS